MHPLAGEHCECLEPQDPGMGSYRMAPLEAELQARRVDPSQFLEILMVLKSVY